MSMSKLDMLFIRACKSNDVEKRLRSVHKRFYARGLGERVVKEAITSILARLADEYAFPKPDLCKVIRECQPDVMMMSVFGEQYDYHTQCSRTLSKYLRYTTGDHLEKLGYIRPVMFRRNESET